MDYRKWAAPLLVRCRHFDLGGLHAARAAADDKVVLARSQATDPPGDEAGADVGNRGHRLNLLALDALQACRQLERQELARAIANQLEISVAKNRGGMLGRVELFCDIGCNVIRDFGGQP